MPFTYISFLRYNPDRGAPDELKGWAIQQHARIDGRNLYLRAPVCPDGLVVRVNGVYQGQEVSLVFPSFKNKKTVRRSTTYLCAEARRLNSMKHENLPHFLGVLVPVVCLGLKAPVGILFEQCSGPTLPQFFENSRGMTFPKPKLSKRFKDGMENILRGAVSVITYLHALQPVYILGWIHPHDIVVDLSMRPYSMKLCSLRFQPGTQVRTPPKEEQWRNHIAPELRWSLSEPERSSDCYSLGKLLLYSAGWAERVLKGEEAQLPGAFARAGRKLSAFWPATRSRAGKIEKWPEFGEPAGRQPIAGVDFMRYGFVQREAEE